MATRLLILALVALCLCAHGAAPAQKVATATLHNVFQLDGGLFSGDAPDSEEAFRELQKLDVKTIISVDGAKPNLELAHRFGLRYVHLPFGYDGLPRARALELTRAFQLFHPAGLIYLHCHHGQHRGPTAVAAICRATQGWSADEADAFLQQAGTSPDYAGLFRDVRAFAAPDATELARLPATFPETAPTPALVDAMVALDEHYDALKTAQKSDWPANSERSAVLAWELLRELARTASAQNHGPKFERHRAESEQAADALRQLLRDPASYRAARDTALRAFGQTCADCHKVQRN